MPTFPRFQLARFPATQNRSLRAWNAADEYILNYLEEKNLSPKAALYHDRFGYLGCHLSTLNPVEITEYKSQEEAIELNLKRLKLPALPTFKLIDSLAEKVDVALIKIPKSMGLFRMYLHSAYQNLSPNGQIICGFMTRHFSGAMLRTAGDFFDEVNQTKAWKKSRLLLLSGKKDTVPAPEFDIISLDHPTLGGGELRQYPGVFSAGQIDLGTRFLLDNLEVRPSDETVLDLASGNGILAHAVRAQNQHAHLHLLDDSWLAIESSKLKLASKNTHFHFQNSLHSFENGFFDLVISNPPFHFEHENNIEVSLILFAEVYKKLKPSGRFRLVANRHLNYGIHLKALFGAVHCISQNDKFEVLEAVR